MMMAGGGGPGRLASTEADASRLQGLGERLG